MVNTFIIADTPQECARLLHHRHLGKQRVEAYQIVNVIEKQTKGWSLHPATLMWMHHLDALKYYTNCMIDEWISRGYVNNMKKYKLDHKPKMPWWFSWKPLQTSHKCSLLRKNEYYRGVLKLEKWEKKYVNYGYIWISRLTMDQIKFAKNNKDKPELIDPKLYCSDIGTGAPATFRWTLEEAKKWLKNKDKNPKTGRDISSTSAIYKDIVKACKLYGLM
jgi:hypothetical protein